MNPSKTPEETERSQSSNSKFVTAIVIGLIAVAVVVIAGAYSTSLVFSEARKAQGAQQVNGIVSAVKLYETQYGVLPRIGAGSVPTEPPLIDILTGHDTVNNPKGTVFLEGKQAKPAKGSRPPRAGIIVHAHGSQSLVDPWGNFYMVRIDEDGDGYIDDPSGGKAIPAKVICWSYGEPSDNRDYRSARNNDPAEWITSW